MLQNVNLSSALLRQKTVVLYLKRPLKRRSIVRMTQVFRDGFNGSRWEAFEAFKGLKISRNTDSPGPSSQALGACQAICLQNNKFSGS
jgi:hypothetical protein